MVVLNYKSGILYVSMVALLTLLPVSGGRRATGSPTQTEMQLIPTHKVRVVAERFSFTPSQIRVKEGVTLEVTLSSDDTFHGFHIPSAGINKLIPARGRGDIRVVFEARRKGRYMFECSRACGAGHTMMRGVIVVE